MSNFDSFKKDMLTNTFTATFDKNYSGEQLNLFQLNSVFKEYENDLEGLKNVILDSLSSYKGNIDKGYFLNILSAYANVYMKKDKSLNLNGFALAFMDQYREKKQINDIHRKTKTIFSHSGSNMYRPVYEDDNVRISCVDGINGVFVEKKSYKINNERYYLYPTFDADDEVYIERINGVLPEDVISELTNVSTKSVMNPMTSIIEMYDKYTPNEKVYEDRWPVFTRDNFIDLTGDDSLSQDEKFDKTCEIVKNSSYISYFIRTSQKTY